MPVIPNAMSAPAMPGVMSTLSPSVNASSFMITSVNQSHGEMQSNSASTLTPEKIKKTGERVLAILARSYSQPSRSRDTTAPTASNAHAESKLKGIGPRSTSRSRYANRSPAAKKNQTETTASSSVSALTQLGAQKANLRARRSTNETSAATTQTVISQNGTIANTTIETSTAQPTENPSDWDGIGMKITIGMLVFFGVVVGSVGAWFFVRHRKDKDKLAALQDQIEMNRRLNQQERDNFNEDNFLNETLRTFDLEDRMNYLIRLHASTSLSLDQQEELENLLALHTD